MYDLLLIDIITRCIMFLTITSLITFGSIYVIIRRER